MDPWWEVCFDQLAHVHSIDIHIGRSKQCDVSGYLFLLSRPRGFEDPFIKVLHPTMFVLIIN